MPGSPSRQHARREPSPAHPGRGSSERRRHPLGKQNTLMFAFNSSKMVKERGLGFRSPAAHRRKSSTILASPCIRSPRTACCGSLATDGPVKPSLENHGFPLEQHPPRPVCGKPVEAEGLMSCTDACSQDSLPRKGFPGGSVDKNLPASSGDTGSILVWRDSTCMDQLSSCTPTPELAPYSL